MPQKRRVRVDSGQPVAPRVAQPDFGSGSKAPQPATEPAAVDDPDLCACPRLDRDDWHEVESDWRGLTFVRSSLFAFMGVPLNYRSARQNLEAAAVGSGATIPDDAMFFLGRGRFRRQLLLEVDDAPAEARGVVRPGGVGFSRLVPAPMGQMKKVVAETSEIASERYKRKPDAIWLWYLTCRVCSEARNFETLIIAHYRE